MLIKEIIKNSKFKDELKIVVFEGDPNKFYGWFEYRNKNVQYNFKITLEMIEKDKISLNLILDGVRKEYRNLIQDIISSIQIFYNEKNGIDIKYNIEKKYLKKEALLDLLCLKN